jgi:hypothetical protein
MIYGSATFVDRARSSSISCRKSERVNAQVLAWRNRDIICEGKTNRKCDLRGGEH